jgi:hypothetical protein
VLNDLRGHGVLLPCEFGTIVRGPEDLEDLVDKQLNELRSALKELLATTWWSVSLYALDSHIATQVDSNRDVQRTRERQRESYSSIAQPKKLDIKTLERVLQKEKRLAESIHEQLQRYAERTDLEHMVGLSSGYSEDWKLIMKSSYEVRNQDVQRLFRAVTEIQYHHMLLEIRLSVSGNRETFPLRSR